MLYNPKNMPIIITMNTAALTLSNDGMTITYGAAFDARIKYLGGTSNGLPVVVAVSEKAATELASEAKAWGLGGKVRFAV